MHFENRHSLLCVPDNESMRIGNVGFRLIATLIYIFFIFLLLLSVYIFILECRFTFFVLRLVLLHAVLHVVSYRNRSRPRRLVHGRFFWLLSRIVSAWSRDGWTWNANLFYLFISYFFRGLYRWCSREKRNGHNCNRLEKEEQGCDEWKEDNHQTMRHTKVLHFFFFVWERCRFLRPFWKWPDM